MTQKELKQLYIDTIAKDVWPKDQRMVDYCAKKAEYIVPLDGGYILEIDKPSINKDFCFGYSLSSHDSESYDEANSMVTFASSDTDYFMEKNLKEIDDIIAHLKGYASDRYEFYLETPYYDQLQSSILKGLRLCDDREEAKRKGLVPLSENDRLAIIEGYTVVRAAFVKRLNTYLKKYGLSKVHAWSFWRDE